MTIKIFFHFYMNYKAHRDIMYEWSNLKNILRYLSHCGNIIIIVIILYFRSFCLFSIYLYLFVLYVSLQILMMMVFVLYWCNFKDVRRRCFIGNLMVCFKVDRIMDIPMVPHYFKIRGTHKNSAKWSQSNRNRF